MRPSLGGVAWARSPCGIDAGSLLTRFTTCTVVLAESVANQVQSWAWTLAGLYAATSYTLPGRANISITNLLAFL